MDVEEWLRAHEGIASRAELARAGFTRTAITRAALDHVGRLHLALPEAAAPLRRAAEQGGTLACVSAAAFRGLSILHAPAEIHIAVPVHSGIPPSPGIRHHRTARHLPPNRLVESMPDILEHVARCLPRAEALVVWESALHRRAVSRHELGRIAWRSRAARRLAADASPDSESVIETLLLHALRDRGIDARQQARLHGHRVDFLIGRSLVVQADGFEHHSDRVAWQRDIDHDARLKLAGYTVLRFTYDDIVLRLPMVIDRIRRAVAQGLHEMRVNA